MASRLQDVILRGLSTARPAATTVAPGTLYYSTDLQTTDRCNDLGTLWETYSDAGGGGGGPLGPHAPTHEPGGTDPLTVDAAPTVGSLRTLGTGPNQAAAGNDARLTNARTPTAHAATHASAGTDPVGLLGLAGYPGGTSAFLRSDATFVVPTIVRIGAISMMIDAGSSVITTGFKGFIEIPFACVIQQVTLLAEVVGSIVIDIWKDAYVNYPPTVVDSITAAAKPTLSSAVKSQNTTLVGWTTSISAGDIIGFNVDSVATLTRVTLSIKVQI